MVLSYLLLVHSGLSNVKRLIKSISTEESKVYVHVDIKNDEDLSIIERLSNVKLIKRRFNIQWGGFSIIAALIECLKEIQSDGCEFVILLSGADYPVKNKSYIKKYIDKYGNTDFIQGEVIPSEKCHWLEGGRRRLECYALRLRDKEIATVEPRTLNLGNIRQFIKTMKFTPDKIWDFLKIYMTFPQRRHPETLKPYSGEMWWGLRMSTINKLLSYIDEHPEFVEYHKATCIPDEIFFSTLVYNLIPHNEINNDCLRFINWDNGNPGNSPNNLTLSDVLTIDKVIAADKYLFARKVTDETVINYINDKIRCKKEQN